MSKIVSGAGAYEDVFHDLSPLLFSIAYRMLSSVSEAEDVVQDAFLRYQRAIDEGTRIESPKAYLSAVTTRLAIDALRSARARRETYVGQWLPEPLLTDDANDPATELERVDSLSMAFLLMLERLNPVERAVFLLHDVFGYDYDEIGEIVEKTEANCRQYAARARRHLRAEKPRFKASRQERDELGARFFAAVGEGNLDALIEMLAEDVVVYGDGGGKAPQWSGPIVGVNRVARLLAGMGRQITDRGARLELRQINGQPGALVVSSDDELISAFVLEIVDGVVQAFRSVINPDKLRHIGPVADVRVLLRTTQARAGRPSKPGNA